MNEQDYYQLWQQSVSSNDPFEMAVQGGAIADDPGLIFSAGYQACIRATFPELTSKRWFSFAVSEDRSPDSTRPGVTMESEGVKDLRVTGFKTWIAALDVVDFLVLKVGSGIDAVYGVVDATAGDVILTRKPNPEFLAGMSQGMAEFRHVKFEQLENATGVKRFTQFEPFYIYIAFLGKLENLRSEVSSLAVETLQQQRQDPNLVQLDQQVNQILEQMSQSDISIGDNWATDRRLFTMYSKSIQAA